MKEERSVPPYSLATSRGSNLFKGCAKLECKECKAQMFIKINELPSE